MSIDFSYAMSVATQDVAFEYTDTQTMLYALAVGMGRDPLDQSELNFVYEKNLKAMPTLATVIAWGARDVRTLGVDYAKVLHGEQRLTLHRSLPVAAKLKVDTRTKSIHDKGVGKGALIVSEITIKDASTGELICTLEPTHFARGDGGFSEKSGDSGPAILPHAIPNRPADLHCELATHLEQPLIYRLLGDRNVLHVDPDAARNAGFNHPILHGLCTYGMSCYAILKTICDYRTDLIRQFDVRFSAPVLPGDTLKFEMWQDNNIISFRAVAKERGFTVIDNGRCVLGSEL